MRSRLAVVLLVLSPALLGEPTRENARVKPIPFTDLQQAPRVRPAEVELIVEFREPRRGMDRASMQARTQALQARVATLRTDLSRLEKRELSATSALQPARIERTFSRVLFGASIQARPELQPVIAALPYVASVHVGASSKRWASSRVSRRSQRCARTRRERVVRSHAVRASPSPSSTPASTTAIPPSAAASAARSKSSAAGTS